MVTFIEAAFVRATHGSRHWQDHSTPDYYIFVSEFGMLQFRRRDVYPQTFAYAQGSKLFFGYGQLPPAEELDKPLASLSMGTFCGEEFLAGVADCSSQKLFIQRDAVGTMPLFVGRQGDQLAFSNKYERVCGLLDAKTFHPHLQTLVEHLLGEHSYERTLVEEITVLSDRMRLTWDDAGYCLSRHPGTYAQDDAESNPAEFRSRLDDVLASYWERYAQTNPMGLELSGGMDSTSIAAFSAQTHKPFLACTVIYPGHTGERQKRKLSELREGLNITSEHFVADSATEHPISQPRKQSQPFYHREELYSPSLSHMARYMNSSGVTAVIRGIGGDELCENIPDRHFLSYESPLTTHVRRLDNLSTVFTPKLKEYARNVMAQANAIQSQPFTSSTAAAAPASGNNLYLDYDIWPIAPLTEPGLYRYTQNLAPKYRMHKNILRAYATARGVPRSIAHPETTEGFSDFLSRSLPYMRDQFNRCMSSSILNKAGLLDLGGLRDAWDSGDAAEQFALYQILVAEMNLQQLGHVDISAEVN